MDNLTPKHHTENSNIFKNLGTNSRSTSVSGFNSKTSKKKYQGDDEVGLSKEHSILLGITIIILSLAVVFLGLWIYHLSAVNIESTLIIKNLEEKVSKLQLEVIEPDGTHPTNISTSNYTTIPNVMSPNTDVGMQNPTIAKEEQFDFDTLFKESDLVVEKNNSISYYVCNAKAALRLIRDSQLPYLISKNTDDSYNLVLLGDYTPSWIEKLSILQKEIQLAVFKSVETTSGTDTTVIEPVPQIPDELKGLEVEKQNKIYSIQLLADTNLEKITGKANILKNDDIPVFLYKYFKSETQKYWYSLRIGYFQERNDAEIYSSHMNRTRYFELIAKNIDDKFIIQLK